MAEWSTRANAASPNTTWWPAATADSARRCSRFLRILRPPLTLARPLRPSNRAGFISSFLFDTSPLPSTESPSTDFSTTLTQGSIQGTSGSGIAVRVPYTQGRRKRGRHRDGHLWVPGARYDQAKPFAPDVWGTDSRWLQHKIIIVRQAAAGSGSGQSHWAAGLAPSCDILFPPIARGSRYRPPAACQASDVVVLQLARGRLISHIKRGGCRTRHHWHPSRWLLYGRTGSRPGTVASMVLRPFSPPLSISLLPTADASRRCWRLPGRGRSLFIFLFCPSPTGGLSGFGFLFSFERWSLGMGRGTKKPDGRNGIHIRTRRAGGTGYSERVTGWLFGRVLEGSMIPHFSVLIAWMVNWTTKIAKEGFFPPASLPFHTRCCACCRAMLLP